MMWQDPVGSLSPRLTVALARHGTAPHPWHEAPRSRCRGGPASGAWSASNGASPRGFRTSFRAARRGAWAWRGRWRSTRKLIIADEPTAGLDVSVQAEILNLLNELQARLGVAILVITHNLNVVRHITDRMAIMYLGRFVEQGPTEEVFFRPRHPYTEALLVGEPRARSGRRSATGSRFPARFQA